MIYIKLIITISFFVTNSLFAQPVFTDAIELGKITDKDLDEASGLAVSYINPGILWTHNDGDDGKIYALDLSGNIVAEYKIKGSDPNDWEDMSIGPGPEDGKYYLYIADFGDNVSIRNVKSIIRFPEPKIPDKKKKYKAKIKDYDRISFTYENGNRDAETVLIDPTDKSIYIVTKREPKVFLYQIKYPQKTDVVYDLNPISQLNIGNTAFGKMITGGDISPDGSEILLKDYNSIYYFKRNIGESLSDALHKQPMNLPYKKELQGEAICWDTAGLSYFTLSEWVKKTNPVIYYYHRIPSFLKYFLIK
jgi:hypothetical protein